MKRPVTLADVIRFATTTNMDLKIATITFLLMLWKWLGVRVVLIGEFRQGVLCGWEQRAKTIILENTEIISIVHLAHQKKEVGRSEKENPKN